MYDKSDILHYGMKKATAVSQVCSLDDMVDYLQFEVNKSNYYKYLIFEVDVKGKPSKTRWIADEIIRMKKVKSL